MTHILKKSLAFSKKPRGNCPIALLATIVAMATHACTKCKILYEILHIFSWATYKKRQAW
jgi:hypothetical protein